MEEKTCAVCGAKVSIFDNINVSKQIKPHTLEEKYYYNLWHKNVEYCPNCGYASFDVSQTKNLNIVANKKYKSIKENDMLTELCKFKQNNAKFYLMCGTYYNLVGEKFDEAISFLNASDEILGVVNYLNLQVFSTPQTPDEKNIEKKFVKFANLIFKYALGVLSDFCKTNDDVNAKIVYGGALLDGNKKQTELGTQVLNELLNKSSLSAIQEKTILYLLKK